MKAVQLFGAICGVAMIAACAADSNNPTAIVATQAKTGITGATPGTDTSANPPVTSSGPVASVIVMPHAVTIAVGHYLTPSIFAYDAKGVRVVGKVASWRSANPSIVVTGDTGVISGRALGATKVYGTIDGYADSISVTVVDAPATNPPPAPAPGVSAFDLTVSVTGSVFSGPDTSNVTRVAGAIVTLTRVGDINGDTLTTAVPAGSGTTDANGNVSFKSLIGGSYTVEITPPAGSPYVPIKSGFYRPTVSDIHMTFTLQKS
jgi:hypothetical protein